MIFKGPFQPKPLCDSKSLYLAVEDLRRYWCQDLDLLFFVQALARMELLVFAAACTGLCSGFVTSSVDSTPVLWLLLRWVYQYQGLFCASFSPVPPASE